jgi:hypothetical protein
MRPAVEPAPNAHRFNYLCTHALSAFSNQPSAISHQLSDVPII